MKMKITLKKSVSGALPVHRRTIKALGLYKMNHSVEKEITPAIKGMLLQVAYLLKLEEVK